MPKSTVRKEDSGFETVCSRCRSGNQTRKPTWTMRTEQEARRNAKRAGWTQTPVGSWLCPDHSKMK